LAALVSTLVTAPVGQATSGGWGSGSWPYSNGVVCDSGGTSVPLVAWRLDGVASPAFLTTGISEVNGVDSGQPSIAANTPDPVLTPQTVGNLSQAQISAIAYLIATWGASASPARVAEVSELVAELAGTPLGADCLAAGTGATSTAEEQSMRTQALQLAGPYTVKLTSPATVAVSAAPIAVAANVTSALGYPVAGIAVQFAGTNVSQPVTATTDASGNASAHLTAVAVGSAPITVTATVAAPIGLRVRSGAGGGAGRRAGLGPGLLERVGEKQLQDGQREHDRIDVMQIVTAQQTSGRLRARIGAVGRPDRDQRRQRRAIRYRQQVVEAARRDAAVARGLGGHVGDLVRGQCRGRRAGHGGLRGFGRFVSHGGDAGVREQRGQLTGGDCRSGGKDGRCRIRP
jgi:hypothetical protein